MDNKPISTQEWLDLDNQIKEVGRKFHEKQLRDTWLRACRQMLQDISDDILKHAHKAGYKYEAILLRFGQDIKNFRIPEYREPEQKEIE